MQPENELFINLTWDDLRDWSGSKILNRGKAYIKNVSDLARTEEGAWVAWVSGSEVYATFVETDEAGAIDWDCTCPFDWGPCKHAVAVILAGIERIKAGKEIPLLEEESDLYLALGDGSGEDGDDLFESDDFAEPAQLISEPGLLKVLRKKSEEELLNLLIDLAGRYPEVGDKIMEEDQLVGGRVDEITRALRKEIQSVTGEDAWYNSWKDQGNLPDYSHILERMSALLEKGHADAVVELGEELWKRASEQVEQSGDDGYTAGEIQTCMEVVFKAICASSLDPPEQLLRMIDIFLGDEFAICDPFESFIRRKVYRKEDWRIVGEKLEQRLAAPPKAKGDRLSDCYWRKQLMDRLIEAFERSGRKEKIIPLYEKEISATQCYEDLVDAYINSGQPEKARSCCIKGFAETINGWPGIARGLRDKLRELATTEKRFDLTASYRAEDFFDRPSRAAYLELRKAAEKIKLWPEVRKAVLCFLETGRRPEPTDRGAKKRDWPLPAAEVKDQPAKRFRERYPDFNTLIDIAILEKRNDDVVRLYREQQKASRWGGTGMGEKVAAAVVESHPDAALAIWKQLAVGRISLVKPKEYEAAAVYLRKMRGVYRQTGRTDEWRQLIVALRTEHKAKRRLMEVLDSLENKRIID